MFDKNKVMKLSKNFTLEEMVATSHKGLQDIPALEVVQNLQKLCVLVLQPLRDTIGSPVYINSGYRSKRLNARVGGVPNSRHLQGRAADIHCDNIERRRPTPNSSVANEGFAPLGGAAATPVAALKTPVASREGGGSCWVHVQM